MNTKQVKSAQLASLLAVILLGCIVASAPGDASAEAEYDLVISAYPEDSGPYVMDEDTLTISASARNWGEAVWVDAHIAIVTPDGTIHEWPDWNTDFRPVLSGYFMHPGWRFETELGTYGVGDPAFPASEPGNYLLVAALTEPGTLNFLSNLSCHTVTVVPKTDPNETWGGLGIDWVRSYEGDNEEGDVTVYAGAAFKGHYGQQEPDPGRGVLSDDDCHVYSEDEFYDMYYGPDYDYGYVRGLDAGEKIDMLGGPLGDVELKRWVSYGNYIGYSPDDGWLEQGHYGGGNTYTFVGYGGPDVGPINVSLVAPPTLDLIKPDLGRDAFGHFHVIPRDRDLTMRWTGQSDRPVKAVIFAPDPMDAADNKVCFCTFDDDGEAVIPSLILMQLPACDNPYLPASFQIKRENAIGFDADGLSEKGEANIASSTVGIAELQ